MSEIYESWKKKSQEQKVVSTQDIENFVIDAINSVFLKIQTKLGVTDGGFAGQWYAGSMLEKMTSTMVINKI